MSTPIEQQLTGPIEKIQEGIREFHCAVAERVKHKGEWKATHIYEIQDVRKSLIDIETKLATLLESTI